MSFVNLSYHVLGMHQGRRHRRLSTLCLLTIAIEEYKKEKRSRRQSRGPYQRQMQETSGSCGPYQKKERKRRRKGVHSEEDMVRFILLLVVAQRLGHKVTKESETFICAIDLVLTHFTSSTCVVVVKEMCRELCCVDLLIEIMVPES